MEDAHQYNILGGCRLHASLPSGQYFLEIGGGGDSFIPTEETIGDARDHYKHDWTFVPCMQ